MLNYKNSKKTLVFSNNPGELNNFGIQMHVFTSVLFDSIKINENLYSKQRFEILKINLRLFVKIR